MTVTSGTICIAVLHDISDKIEPFRYHNGLGWSEPRVPVDPARACPNRL